MQITKTTVKVSWEKPEYDGGSKVTSYLVEISKFEEDNFTCAGEVAQQSYEITDLTEDCKYDVRVKAVNEIGQGVPSATITAIHTR
ncbi:MAG: fibronectin type III domain-containing protein, partial [Bacteroidota bacterium]